MLTPAFDLSQDPDFLTVAIRVPHARVSEFDVYFQGVDFKFYAKPYFLRRVGHASLAGLAAPRGWGWGPRCLPLLGARDPGLLGAGRGGSPLPLARPSSVALSATLKGFLAREGGCVTRPRPAGFRSCIPRCVGPRRPGGPCPSLSASCPRTSYPSVPDGPSRLEPRPRRLSVGPPSLCRGAGSSSPTPTARLLPARLAPSRG